MAGRIIKLLISAVYYAAAATVHAIARSVKPERPGTLVVLTYHAVKPNQKAKFQKQLDMLVGLGTPVFADIQSPLPQGKHHIAVTFDDGYASFLEHAFPLLHEKNIPATLFVPVGYLGKSPGWITKQDHPNYMEKVMTEQQLRELSGRDVVIGSHCISHPKLTKLSSEQARREISGSKSILESILQKKVILLAFPYNDYNKLTLEEAEKAGYSRVFSNVPTYPISRIDSFILGRIDVTPDDSFAEFWLKAKGAYEWLPFAIAAKRTMKLNMHQV